MNAGCTCDSKVLQQRCFNTYLTSLPQVNIVVIPMHGRQKGQHTGASLHRNQWLSMMLQMQLQPTMLAQPYLSQPTPNLSQTRPIQASQPHTLGVDTVQDTPQSYRMKVGQT